MCTYHNKFCFLTSIETCSQKYEHLQTTQHEVTYKHIDWPHASLQFELQFRKPKQLKGNK